MKNKKLLFTVYAYGIFWSMLIIFAICSMFFNPNPKTTKAISLICSWSPFFAVMLLFKKLDTGFESRIEFIKNQFENKKAFKPALLLLFLMTALFFASSILVSVFLNRSFKSLFSFSAKCALEAFIFTILGGAVGEEVGWRGFLLKEQLKSYSVLKASVLNGIIWTVWHTPLFFIRTDSGLEMLVYIIAFSISAVCASVIIGISYSKYQNLIIPISVHFSMNFFVCFFKPEIKAYIILSSMALMYFLTSLVFIFLFKRKSIKQQK